MEKIIDTNVPLTSVDLDSVLGLDCVLSCIRLMKEIHEGRYTLVLDDSRIVLSQYEANIRKGGDHGMAGHFLSWVYSNYVNEEKVRLVKVERLGAGDDFEELPDEVRQSGFDRSDRVFVALSIANGNKAPIVQAADSKWIGWEELLARHGVRLEFPCRQALEVVHKRKDKRRK